MKDDFGCVDVAHILILWKGGSGRNKDDFVSRSYFDSVEGEERENQRQLFCRTYFNSVEGEEQ
jgi:hypothetical protein